jgi:hypothetical protein
LDENRKENRNLDRSKRRSWNSSRSREQLLSWLLFVVKGLVEPLVKVVECKSDLMKILVGHIVTIVIVYNCEGCYCHNLSFSRGMLLSQLVKSGAAIVIVYDDK